MESFTFLKESIKIKQKVLFSLKESLIFLQQKYYEKKWKYYDIRQVNLMFSKESNKVSSDVP